MTDIYYAHSGDAENNILHPQKYNVHVECVHDTAVDFIKECIAHSATLTLNQKHFVKDVVAQSKPTTCTVCSNYFTRPVKTK